MGCKLLCIVDIDELHENIRAEIRESVIVFDGE